MSTRDDLVTAAAALLQEQGYHATTMQQIAEAAGREKGSLYHFFPKGKDQIVVIALLSTIRDTGRLVERAILGQPTPVAAVGYLLDVLGEELEGSGFLRGSPIATVVLDAAAQSDQIADAADRAYAQWIRDLEVWLDALGDPKATATAAAIVSLIEGALVIARAARSTAALDAVKSVLPALLAPAEQAARSLPE